MFILHRARACSPTSQPNSSLVNCPQTVKYVVGKNLKSTGILLSAWLFSFIEMTWCRPMVSCWFLYCYMEALDLFKCLLWSYFGKCKQYAPPFSILKTDEKICMPSSATTLERKCHSQEKVVKNKYNPINKTVFICLYTCILRELPL